MPAAEWVFFEILDEVRRAQGAAMDALGLGPIETPHETVFAEPGLTLRRYGTGSEKGPRVVLVTAPIKRPYVWDLAPDISVVQRCLHAGAHVFLLDWQPAPPDFGFAEYAERLIADSLNAIGQGPAVLIGHSLGGLFAAVFAALHPERVCGLVLLASPLDFAAGVGILRWRAGAIALQDLPEHIPGSFLSAASMQASPATFVWERWLDFVASSAQPEALRNHLRVERWTMDEFALPRRLFVELADVLRENRFVRGTLTIAAHRAAPSRIAAPLLCVVDPRCRVVPPESVLPFFAAAGSRDKTVLHYHGDVGVSLQHIGMLVGKEAHAQLWPEILRWIARRASGYRGAIVSRPQSSGP